MTGRGIDQTFYDSGGGAASFPVIEKIIAPNHMRCSPIGVAFEVARLLV